MTDTYYPVSKARKRLVELIHIAKSLMGELKDQKAVAILGEAKVQAEGVVDKVDQDISKVKQIRKGTEKEGVQKKVASEEEKLEGYLKRLKKLENKVNKKLGEELQDADKILLNLNKRLAEIFKLLSELQKILDYLNGLRRSSDPEAKGLVEKSGEKISEAKTVVQKIKADLKKLEDDTKAMIEEIKNNIDNYKEQEENIRSQITNLMNGVDRAKAAKKSKQASELSVQLKDKTSELTAIQAKTITKQKELKELEAMEGMVEAVTAHLGDDKNLFDSLDKLVRETKTGHIGPDHLKNIANMVNAIMKSMDQINLTDKQVKDLFERIKGIEGDDKNIGKYQEKVSAWREHHQI